MSKNKEHVLKAKLIPGTPGPNFIVDGFRVYQAVPPSVQIQAFFLSHGHSGALACSPF